MSLSKRLMGNMFGRKHDKRRSILENAVDVAVEVAATAAINRLAQQAVPMINNAVYSRPAYTPPKPAPASNLTPAVEKRFNTLMAKLAVCYYVAGLDGYISDEERAVLNEANEVLQSDPTIPDVLKHKVGDVMDPTISFVKVQQYLDKAESAALISFAYEIEDLAKKEGLSPKEEDAVEMYKYYVTERTGHKFIKATEEEPEIPKEIDLTCSACGGQMELDSTMIKASCIYCGTTKIIDASQIKDIVSQIERSKRLGL